MSDEMVESSMVEEYDTEAMTLEEPSGEGSVPKGRDEGAIPDLLRVGEIEHDFLAHIDTTIHEPVIFTDSFIRFQLDHQGFLNPYSRLCFSLKNTTNTGAADKHRASYPINVGSGAIFSRVTLKIGGKTITEIEDFGHFHQYKSQFLAGEINKEREQVLSGRMMAHAQVFGNASQTKYLDSNNDQNDVGTTSWRNGLDTNREYNQDNLQWNDWALVNREGIFSITLEELLPVLRRTALPLYMLNSDQAVQIELTLAENDARYVTQLNDANKVMQINRPDCRIIADYTTYDQPIMDRYAQENKNISWTFMDYQLTKLSVTQASATTFSRNVGGAGRLVPRVFCGIEQDGQTSANLLNKYCAQGTAAAGGNYTNVTTNIKKNDQFLYPIDRSNAALHFHGVKDTEGMIPFVTSDEYSGQGSELTEFFFEKVDQEVALANKFFWLGYKMVDNERVGTRGLEITSQYPALPAGGTWRCYIEAIKVAVMNEGRFDCYYA